MRSVLFLVVLFAVLVSSVGFVGSYEDKGLRERLMKHVDEFPPEHEPIIPEESGVASEIGLACEDLSDQDQVVDVMVVYTTAAREDAENSGFGIDEVIELAISLTNEAYENSDMQQRINLVHMQEIEYDEGENVPYGVHLSRLRIKDDGFMDEVHSLREQYGVDLVQLIVKDDQSCGVGYQMTHFFYGLGFEFLAFSVVNWECSAGVYTSAHEFGHNMGNGHETNFSSGFPVFDYSYGWNLEGDHGEWKTVMAVNPGFVRVPYFSNPDVLFDEMPTGVEEEADNARSMDETNLVVSNFRCHKLCPGMAADINNDGVVESSDLIYVLQNWGSMDEDADVNGDGVVDTEDIVLILLNWGPCANDGTTATQTPNSEEVKKMIKNKLGAGVLEIVESEFKGK